MTEKLKQIIEEEVAKLPRETQEAINSVAWTSTLEAMGKKYLLTENEINDLQVETLLVLIGMENVNDYPKNIENEVETTKNEAEKIADEVFQKIFTPIRNALEENIKNNVKNKNPNLEQTIDFILSGGDYLTLVERPVYENRPGSQETVLPTFSITK